MPKKLNANTKSLLQKIDELTKERMREQEIVPIDQFKKTGSKNRPSTLLIVEDDRAIRKALTRTFSEEGYVVVSAGDSRELTAVMSEYNIDLILLDIGLPWVDGFELAEMMKAYEDLKEIPIIFVSGKSDPEHMKKAFKVGAHDFIAKPFEIGKIKKAVSSVLKLQ